MTEDSPMVKRRLARICIGVGEFLLLLKTILRVIQDSAAHRLHTPGLD